MPGRRNNAAAGCDRSPVSQFARSLWAQTYQSLTQANTTLAGDDPADEEMAVTPPTGRVLRICRSLEAIPKQGDTGFYSADARYSCNADPNLRLWDSPTYGDVPGADISA